MTSKAVGYARGVLWSASGTNAGGPGKYRAGVAQEDASAARTVQTHAAAGGFEVLVWLNDDGEDRGLRADFQLGIQRALFLLRADFLDVLYIHRRTDVNPADLAILAAEVEVAGKALVVAGERVVTVEQVASSPEEAELARLGARLRAKAAARRTSGESDDDFDIGANDSRSDAARLAHKLTQELHLPSELIARLLGEANYEVGAAIWNRQAVARLLDIAPEYVSCLTRDEAWSAHGGGTMGMSIDVFYVPAGWNERQNDDQTIVLPQEPGQSDGEPADQVGLVVLLTLLRWGVVRKLSIPDPAVLGSWACRLLLLGEARAAETPVVIAGVSLEQQEDAGDLAVNACVAARLHRALRAHDGSTIVLDEDAHIDTLLTDFAEKHKRNPSLREAAAWLGHRGVRPPSTRGGNWSHSAVGRRRSER